MADATVVGRQLRRMWIRGSLVIALLVVLPFAEDVQQSAFRALDPGAERAQRARDAEQEARDAGEVFITASGERRRAVVYTPAPPAASPDERALHTVRLGWCWLLAVAALVALLLNTVRMLRGARSPDGDEPARTGPVLGPPLLAAARSPLSTATALLYRLLHRLLRVAERRREAPIMRERVNAASDAYFEEERTRRERWFEGEE